MCLVLFIFKLITNHNVFYMNVNIWPVFLSVKTCGGTLSNSKGVITSPLHPSFYPPAVDCKWTIKVCSSAPFTGPPPLPETPLPTSSFSSILSLPREECWGSTLAAKLFSTSSIFICQNAVAAAALAELQCFVCWFCARVCVYVCVCVSRPVWVCCNLSPLIYMWYR